jgi:hypothetical protein
MASSLLRCRCCGTPLTIFRVSNPATRDDTYSVVHPRKVVEAMTVTGRREIELPSKAVSFSISDVAVARANPKTLGRLIDTQVLEACSAIESACRAAKEAVQPPPPLTTFKQEFMGFPAWHGDIYPDLPAAPGVKTGFLRAPKPVPALKPAPKPAAPEPSFGIGKRRILR